MRTDPIPHSIGKRIHRVVFAISLISLVVTTAAIFFAYTDLEQSMLALDVQAERDFLLEHAEKGTPLTWDTGNLKAFYLPDGMIDRYRLPPLFREMPLPFSGEISFEGRTFLATVANVQGGRLYMARDISFFEQREHQFAAVLAVICLSMIGLSFVLARVSSRRLVVPLQQLAEHLRNTAPGRRMPRIDQRFDDLELRAIADTFNWFLEELEAFVKREQSLLSFASHELRTPIAVISGGLEVIDQRGQLAPSDRKTLRRIQRAATEMQANVDVVLKLARRKEHLEKVECIRLPDLVRELLEELQSCIKPADPIRLSVTATPSVEADPVLVKMLLRNLIQNALQHTAGRISIRLAPGLIELSDQGPGLPEPYRRLLCGKAMSRQELSALPGLGLFIVTLICERLGWQLDVEGSSGHGTLLCLRFDGHADAGAA